MMIGALLALAAAAVAGLFLAIRHFRRKRLPAMVALIHGLGGATGFTLVLLTVVGEPDFRPIRDSLYLLIATVAFGVVNLLFHVRRVRHRTSLIVTHALCAVSGVGLLIRAIVVHHPVETAKAAALASPPAVETPPPAASATEARAAAPSAVESAAPPPEPSPPPASGGIASKAQEGFAVDPGVRQALDQEIQFGSKSATIESSSTPTIADMAKALVAHPEVVLVEVQGHADERGDDARNIVLTHARAHAVVSALVADGVSPLRLHEAGYGARCPANSECRVTNPPPSCHETEQWQKDRRVTFVVLQIGKSPFHGEVVCAAGASLIPPADKRYNVIGR